MADAQTKPTPGKWEFSPSRSSVESSNDQTVCIPFGATKEEAIANAHTLAASKDLLDAARLALAILEHKSQTCRNSSWKCSDQKAFDALTAAIQKAEGR